MPVLLLSVLALFTLFALFASPFAFLTRYSQIRGKGYKPVTAALIVASPWVLAASGAAIWVAHRWQTNSASAIEAMLLPWALFLVVVGLILLKTFPRTIRVAGRRQVPFPFVRVAKILWVGWMVLSIAVPAVFWIFGEFEAPLLWVGVALAVGGQFGLIPFYRYARLVDAKLQLPSFEELLALDPRPPVLFLRPFQMEPYIFADEVNFEQFFHEELRGLGPFIALGNPMDYTPPFGAVRLYASDTDWIEKLGELARRSSCIVAEMARSDNLRAEYEYIRRERLQEKLFVITAHPEWQHRRWLDIWNEKARFGILRVDWQTFAADLKTFGYDSGLTDPGSGAVITFDADARAVVLTTQAKKPVEFVEPIRAWIAERQKVGRSVLTRCLSCSGEFYVFPPGISRIRERWCQACDVGLNVFLRRGRKFIVKHQTISAYVLGISLLVAPIFLVGAVFPKGSWAYEYRGVLGALVIVAEMVLCFVVVVWTLYMIDQRFGRLYRRVADAGDAIAMTNLGIMYRSGQLGRGDRTTAAQWFRKAAEAGDIGGMINLADLLERGAAGLQQDRDEALSWYRRAADLGSRPAEMAIKRLHPTN